MCNSVLCEHYLLPNCVWEKDGTISQTLSFFSRTPSHQINTSLALVTFCLSVCLRSFFLFARPFIVSLPLSLTFPLLSVCLCLSPHLLNYFLNLSSSSPPLFSYLPLPLSVEHLFLQLRYSLSVSIFISHFLLLLPISLSFERLFLELNISLSLSLTNLISHSLLPSSFSLFLVSLSLFLLNVYFCN